MSCILFWFQADGEDELKKRQLMELAIINGTYRDSESMRALAAAGSHYFFSSAHEFAQENLKSFFTLNAFYICQAP